MRKQQHIQLVLADKVALVPDHGLEDQAHVRVRDGGVEPGLVLHVEGCLCARARAGE